MYPRHLCKHTADVFRHKIFKYFDKVWISGLNIVCLYNCYAHKFELKYHPSTYASDSISFQKIHQRNKKKYIQLPNIYILFLTKWCFYDLHTMKYVSASLHLCKQIICDQAGKYFGILRPGQSEIVCICNKRGGAVKQQSEFSLIYVKLQNSI